MATVVSMIVAMAANRCIGRDNRMPWYLPVDLRHFKEATLGRPVIMGRKTFESILASLGKPLPGRTSIILTRNLDYRPPQGTAAGGAGVLMADSPTSALATAAGTGAAEVFVIGGAEIYRAMLPVAQRLVVTEIGNAFEGDAFFPVIDPHIWLEVSRHTQPVSGEPPIPFDFVEYQRRTIP
jgi:dihydrofolate reductase